MSCTDFEQFFAEYVDGTLPAEQATRVDAHLVGCEACRHEVELARVGKENLTQLPKPEVPADLVDRVIDATTQNSSWLTQLKQWFTAVPAPAYALLLIAVAASVLVYRMPGVDKDFMEKAPDVPVLANYKTLEAKIEKAASAADDFDLAKGQESKVAKGAPLADKSKKPVASKKADANLKTRDHVTESDGLLGAIGSVGGSGGGRVLGKSEAGSKGAVKNEGRASGASGEAAPMAAAAREDRPSAPKPLSGENLARRTQNGKILEKKRKKKSAAAPSGEKALPTRPRMFSKKTRTGMATTVSTGSGMDNVVVDQPPYMDETVADQEGAHAPGNELKNEMAQSKDNRADENSPAPIESTLRLADASRADEDTGGEAINLTIEGRYDGNRSGLTRKRTILITSQSRLAKIWAQIWAVRINPPPMPYVDFSRQVAVVCSLGTQTTGGYALRIMNVDRVGNILRVRVTTKRPTKGTGLTQALTQPYSLVVVDIGSGSRQGLKVETEY
jgi:PrcB C-terminal/Putative zinc-finger